MGFEYQQDAQRFPNELRERFAKAKADGDLTATADPSALARYLSAVTVGMGVMASSGADREALRQVAVVSLKAFDEQSGSKMERA